MWVAHGPGGGRKQAQTAEYDWGDWESEDKKMMMSQQGEQEWKGGWVRRTQSN